MDYPAVFVATLFHSGTNAHFQHLMTDSYAKHVALARLALALKAWGASSKEDARSKAKNISERNK